jgi:peroxiredoxin family protein
MTTTLLPLKPAPLVAPLMPARATNYTREPDPKPRAIEHLAIIVSKGSLDMAYPGLILANAARMSGIEATLFFTFWGLDVITEKTVDHLHVATVGNPSMHIPTMLGGLPGMEGFATGMMKKQIDELDIPPVREMLQILGDSGARIYACRMAMDMFKRSKADLVPQVEAVISAMDFFDKAAGAQVIFV